MMRAMTDSSTPTVHNAIRARLTHLRGGEINSVHDLALIIINQVCVS